MLPNANVTYYSRTAFTRAKILFDASKDNDTGGNYFAAHNAYGLFSQFSSLLEDEGHVVDNFKRGELNTTFLNEYDLLIIANPELEYSQNELSAITSLMTAATRPPRAGTQSDEANLLLADLYYSYGLYEESRSLFAQLLNANVSDSVQNRIWFNLARLRYEQGYHDQARALLSLINNQLPR